MEKKEPSLPVSLPLVRERSGLLVHPSWEHSSHTTLYSDNTHPQEQSLARIRIKHIKLSAESDADRRRTVVLTLWLVPHSFTLLTEEKFTKLSSHLIFLPKGNPRRIVTKRILFFCLMLSRNRKCRVLTPSPCFNLFLKVSLDDLEVLSSHLGTGKTRTKWPLSLQEAPAETARLLDEHLRALLSTEP